MRPDCYACYYNIGGQTFRRRTTPRPRKRCKKAVELKPDTAEPYNALANVYNAWQKKFEKTPPR